MQLCEHNPAAQSSSQPRDCAVALGIGLVAGVVVHAAQNARVLVKRIPQEFWQWNKDNEELTGLIIVALCAVYSVPRLWFFFRQNRRVGQVSEEDVRLRQQLDGCSLESSQLEHGGGARCSGAQQEPCSSASNDLTPQHTAPVRSATAVIPQSPAIFAGDLTAFGRSSSLSPRSLSGVNDFIKSPNMTPNGLAAPSAGVHHSHSASPPPPPPASSGQIASYYSALPASDTSPPSRRQHPPVLPHAPQQQSQRHGVFPTTLQSLPSQCLHNVVRHLPLHSRCILALTCTSFKATVQQAPAHAWHHSAVDISIVDGRLLKRVLQRVGHHVRSLTFNQGLSNASAPGLNRLGDGDVCAAVAACPHLLELDCSFTGCGSDIELSKAAKARCCPQLRLLNVRYCSRITDLGLNIAVSGFTCLEVIRCSGNKAVTDAFMFRLSEHCHALLELDCSNTSVSSTGVSVVLRRCPRLQKLYIAHCPLVTDSAFQPLSPSCGPNITGTATRTRSLPGSALTSIDLSGVRAIMMRVISDRCGVTPCSQVLSI